MRTGTISANFSVYCRSSDNRNRKVFISRRNIRSDGASRTATDRPFNAHYFSVIVAPKHENQKCNTNMVLARRVTIIMLGQN